MALNWADRRRLYIIGGASLIALTLLAAIVIAFVYETPSCADGKQNQGEAGIDCGGSCAYLCKADVRAPTVSFARALTNASGRTDVVAYIENRNQDAEAKDAAYSVEVFDDAGVLLGKREGVIDLPARATVPVFIAGAASGIGSMPRAFVSFSPEVRWRSAREAARTGTVARAGFVENAVPRVVATIENRTPVTLYDQTAVATVFDAAGEAIGASRTVVRTIAPQGSSDAVFTWPEAFPVPPSRVEVRIVPRLP